MVSSFFRQGIFEIMSWAYIMFGVVINFGVENLCLFKCVRSHKMTIDQD